MYIINTSPFPQAELEKSDTIWRSELLCTPFAMSNQSLEPLQTRYLKTMITVWKSGHANRGIPTYLENKMEETLRVYALKEYMKKQSSQSASCTECGKIVDKYRLKQHMQTHNFACLECKLTFKNPFQVNKWDCR